MDRACSTHGLDGNAYRDLVGRTEGKRQVGRLRRTWEDNIKMDRREIVWGGMDRINLSRDREYWRAVLNTVMNLRVLQNHGMS
jgi:hypothetical protein